MAARSVLFEAFFFFFLQKSVRSYLQCFPIINLKEINILHETSNFLVAPVIHIQALLRSSLTIFLGYTLCATLAAEFPTLFGRST